MRTLIADADVCASHLSTMLRRCPVRLAKRSRGPAGSLHRTQTISQEAIAELVVCGRWASARERVRKFGKFQLQGRKMGS